MEQNMYEVWADLGPVGNTEKKIWAIKYSIFEGGFCYVFMGKKNVVASALKSCIISLLLAVFLPQNRLPLTFKS